MSAMTILEPEATFRLPAVSVRRPLSRREHRVTARSGRRAEAYSPAYYWLVIKPLLATWVALIPYGLATTALDLVSIRSSLVELAAVALWLAVMAFWPNPALKSEPARLPALAGGQTVVLEPAPVRPRVPFAVIRERVACLFLSPDGAPVSPFGA